MGKTRWERGAQALLETLTAAEGLGSSAIRPLKEVRAKEERNCEGRGRGTSQAGIVGGMESCRMREASLMKYGLLAEELACVPRCRYGWRSARRRNEFRRVRGGPAGREKERDLFYSRIKIPIRTLSSAL